MNQDRTQADPAAPGREAEEAAGTGLEEAAGSHFSKIEDAIEEIRRGRMVVVCDGEARENEGDLVLAAQFATPEAINFMATHGRGLICLCLTEDRCVELGLRPMTDRNETPYGTAFMEIGRAHV